MVCEEKTDSYVHGGVAYLGHMTLSGPAADRLIFRTAAAPCRECVGRTLETSSRAADSSYMSAVVSFRRSMPLRYWFCVYLHSATWHPCSAECGTARKSILGTAFGDGGVLV